MANSRQNNGNRGGAAHPRVLADIAGVAEDEITFHNPYTFIPFGNQPPRRREPTPLTIDELETFRVSGVFEVKVQLLTPLVSSEANPESEREGHKKYRALKIGADVVLPATGVRGALRTLLTLATGGTLGYVDEQLWLCEGRTVQLGENPNAAMIVTPGRNGEPGRVRLGKTKLMTLPWADSLRGDRNTKYWADPAGSNYISAVEGSQTHPWRVFVSGKPVGGHRKKDALFLPDGPEIDLPWSLWEEYYGSHRNSTYPTLNEGDMIWLETQRAGGPVKGTADVRSIQSARWGRRGDRLRDAIRREFWPDSIRDDGLVDEVTDLFGHVPLNEKAAPAFAGRVRPENLVFPSPPLSQVSLAALSSPKPGCSAFYRGDYDPSIKRRVLRGYKVYRATKLERAPWKYNKQPVFSRNGASPSENSQNSTVSLVEAGAIGTLRIAVRALNYRELHLLLSALCVDWRLGGGKPLGLGHARITQVTFIDEFGRRGGLATLGNGDWRNRRNLLLDAVREVIAAVQRPEDGHDTATDERFVRWQQCQRPVERLRYPRAANGGQVGGHQWFGIFAQRSRNRDELAPVNLGEDAERLAGTDLLAAQPLPKFEAEGSDVLYGYDLDCQSRGGKTRVFYRFFRRTTQNDQRRRERGGR